MGSFQVPSLPMSEPRPQALSVRCCARAIAALTATRYSHVSRPQVHRMRRSILLFFTLLLSPLAARADQPDGSFSPIMSSPPAPVRRALLVTPAFAGGAMTPRSALARSDASAYRDLLRLLGFSGTIVSADTRPALRAAVHAFAEAVPRDAEVAVFVLGSIVPAGGKLYVPASDLSSADRAPDRIATAGLDLAEIVGSIAERGAKEVVTFIDECGSGDAKPACDLSPSALPEGVSAIVVHRVPSNASGPIAGVPSVRQDLLPLMREPGLDFLRLYGRLQSRLENTNDGLTATTALSRNFVFLPTDFLSRLPIECNRVDPSAGADVLRHAPSLAPAVAACERAAATYDFSPFFKDKLIAAREQFALQKAVADCNGGAAAAYLDAYPGGAYRFAVSEFVSGCERVRQPPPAPVAPVAPVPPAPEVPDLEASARLAVGVFYDRHSFAAGDDLGAAAALYPPTFEMRQGTVTRDEHIADLARYYQKFATFRFQVVPGSLDTSGCESVANCLVRGTTQANFRKLGDRVEKVSRSRFSLRFDLRRGVKVLYECAVVQQTREQPCE